MCQYFTFFTTGFKCKSKYLSLMSGSTSPDVSILLDLWYQIVTIFYYYLINKLYYKVCLKSMTMPHTQKVEC